MTQPGDSESSEHALILAENLQRAAAFYERVFECVVETGAAERCRFVVPAIRERGAILGVIRRRIVGDHDTINRFTVGSLEQAMDRVLRHEGSVLVTSIGAGHIWFALCQDTEGNRFVIEQGTPPSAVPPGRFERPT
jgi:predicted enzyme related to lactoylglutathione lyase